MTRTAFADLDGLLGGVLVAGVAAPVLARRPAARLASLVEEALGVSAVGLLDDVRRNLLLRLVKKVLR